MGRQSPFLPPAVLAAAAAWALFFGLWILVGGLPPYFFQTLVETLVVEPNEITFEKRYQGKGGVELRNLWRKSLFRWKLDGTPFLLSSYPTAESRVMFHRQIQESVQPGTLPDPGRGPLLAAGRRARVLDPGRLCDLHLLSLQRAF